MSSRLMVDRLWFMVGPWTGLLTYEPKTMNQKLVGGVKL